MAKLCIHYNNTRYQVRLERTLDYLSYVCLSSLVTDIAAEKQSGQKEVRKMILQWKLKKYAK